MGEEADIDSQRLKEKIDELNERLRQGSEDKDLKKAVRKMEKDLPAPAGEIRAAGREVGRTQQLLENG